MQKNVQNFMSTVFDSIYLQISQSDSNVCHHQALLYLQCAALRVLHHLHKMQKIHRAICNDHNFFSMSKQCKIEKNSYSKTKIEAKISHVDLCCSIIRFGSQTRNCTILNTILYPVIPVILHRTLIVESSWCLVILITSNFT